jgi:hypothetical protein
VRAIGPVGTILAPCQLQYYPRFVAAHLDDGGALLFVVENVELGYSAGHVVTVTMTVCFAPRTGAVRPRRTARSANILHSMLCWMMLSSKNYHVHALR